jgi:hypothetical protein
MSFVVLVIQPSSWGMTTGILPRQRWRSATYKAVVFGMCTNPDPNERLASQSAKGTMMIPHSNSEAILATLQSTETERGVMLVAPPQVVILSSQLLDVFGQSVKQVPEAASCGGVHFRGGHSRRSPCADSLSASPKRKSSLPAELS